MSRWTGMAIVLGRCLAWAILSSTNYGLEKVSTKLVAEVDVVSNAFKAMAIILTVGWAIYPIGWIMGQDAGDSGGDQTSCYNIADVVNKTGFGIMVWYAAKNGYQSMLDLKSDYE